MQKTLVITIYIFFSSVVSGNESMSNAEKALSALAHSHSPGIQYVAVNKNTIVFEHSVGLADIQSSIPLSMDHTLPAFSMTKTLTAIAILQLADTNKLELDSPVDKYVSHPYGPSITIRQLISHTAGLPNPIPLRWVHLAEHHQNFNETDALSHILKKHNELESEPGISYEYSNIGYWLLGVVIESVTNQKYSNYVVENIFKPLSLSPQEISFQIPTDKKHAKGYLKKWSFMNLFGRFFIDSEVLGNYEQNWLHIKNVYLNGPSFGGAIGTSKAFSKILQDLLNSQSILLNQSAKSLLFEQQKVKSGEKIDMTLGWHIGNLGGITYYYKEGGGAGFRSEMRIYPDQGIASTLMTNRTSFNTRKNLGKLDKFFLQDGI